VSLIVQFRDTISLMTPADQAVIAHKARYHRPPVTYHDDVRYEAAGREVHTINRLARITMPGRSVKRMCANSHQRHSSSLMLISTGNPPDDVVRFPGGRYSDVAKG
jgi:hypothetical protein